MKWRVSTYALMLAAAGLPLYIHLPRYATGELGMSLATLGVILAGIRVMDFAQDPALGWLVDRYPRYKSAFATAAALGMALGFVMLYTLRPKAVGYGGSSQHWHWCSPSIALEPFCFTVKARPLRHKPMG